MAIVLASYCISSIHTARREVLSPTVSSHREKPGGGGGETPKQHSWVQQALDEQQREVEQRRA